jgi:hypothetical protein
MPARVSSSSRTLIISRGINQPVGSALQGLIQQPFGFQRASVNTTWTCVECCVEVSSVETIVASHLRVTRSMTAVAPMPSQPPEMRCVIDQMLCFV